MQFHRMNMRNWYIFKGEQELVFPKEGLANIMVIFGENGFGKTSLQNAVRWCLYGESLNRQGTEVKPEDIINSSAFQDGETEFEVVLEFTVDNEDYELTRSCKLRVGQSPEITVLLRKGAHVIPGGSVSDEIEAVMPKQISQFMLFDGETLQEFEDLVSREGSPQARLIKENIERALGIPVFKRAEVELQNLNKVLNKERSKDVAAKKSFENLNSTVNLLETDMDSLKKELSLLHDQLKKNRDEVAVLERKVNERAKEVGLAAQRDSLITEANDNAKLISANKEELKVENSGCWKFVLAQTLQPNIQHLEDQIKSLNTRITQIQGTQSKIYGLEKSVESDICDQCGHTLTEQEKNGLKEQITTLKEDFIDLLPLQETLKDYELQVMSIGRLADEESPVKIMTKLTKEILSKTKRNYQIQNEKWELDNKLLAFDKGQAQNDNKQLLLRSEEIGQLENKIELKEKSISDTDHKIKEIKSRPEWKKATEGSGSAMLAEKGDKILLVFQEAMGLYRESMRLKIEKRASETFRMLTTEPDFNQLELNEAYGLYLIAGGERVARSAGVEQIVALSLIESLNHLGRRKGPMFMDTPAGRLDKKHRENIMEYLPKVVTQLVILAHSGELEEDNIYFDQSKIGKKYRINRLGTFHSELEAI